MQKSLPSVLVFPTQRPVAGFVCQGFPRFAELCFGKILSNGGRTKIILPASPSYPPRPAACRPLPSLAFRRARQRFCKMSASQRQYLLFGLLFTVGYSCWRHENGLLEDFTQVRFPYGFLKMGKMKQNQRQKSSANLLALYLHFFVNH